MPKSIRRDDVALLLETLNRIPNRRAAHAVLIGELILDQPRARREASLVDCIAKRAIHAHALSAPRRFRPWSKRRETRLRIQRLSSQWPYTHQARLERRVRGRRECEPSTT